MSKPRLILIVTLGVIIAATTMGADSCGTKTKTTADSGSSEGSSAPAEGPQTAALGDTITLTGLSAKEKIAVTPTKILDPLQVGSFDKPLNKDSRFVGVEVTLRNAGSKTYNDSPENGASVVTANNQQGDPTIVAEGPCSGGFASNANISPGSTLKGCIPFEVPGKSAVAKFQFTLESGFGPQSGEWLVK